MDLWGPFVRALGLIYCISLASLARQLPALNGPHGLHPLAPQLAARARHFGRLRALLYHPTLFWLSASDAALFAVPALGACCGLGAALGGAHSPALLLGAWLALLSIDAGPSALVYPWDSLLLEAGFLALWLPASAPLTSGAPTLAAALLQPLAALPSPLLSFAFRVLLWRLLMGFGKLKFVGSGWWDRLYIKYFLINQPMVTPAGVLAHRLLPDWAWVAMLAQMFVIECVAPFGLFLEGAPRVAAAASIAALMLGIWLTGNYGYFNLLTAAVCLAAADGSAAGALRFSASDLLPPGTPPLATLADAAEHWRSLAIAAILLLYILPLSLLQFIMNSWINLSWAHWGGVQRLRLHWSLWWTQVYARVLRTLGQARIVSAYGVFPPSASPPQRWSLCYEGSSDEGVTWRRYHYAHYLSGPTTPPAFLAPYHPRLDHALFYEPLGGSSTTMSILGHASPYAFHSSAHAWVRLQVLLLQGGEAFLAHARSGGVLFRENPFPAPHQPPRHVRIVACQYTLNSAAVAGATGEHWRERVMGVQYAAISLESLRAASAGSSGAPHWPLCDASPEPEDFWVECEEWRKRAGVCSRGVSEAEYEEAWGFLEAVRRAAGAEAGRAGAGEEGAAVKEASGSGSRSGSRSRSGGGSSSKAGSSSGSSSVPVATPFSPSEPVITQLERRRCVVPLPSQALLGASAALARAQPHAPLPLEAANAAFTWLALPPVVAAVRARYSLAQLAGIRGTLARMAAPLLRGAARVCDRVTPTGEELAAELAALAPAAQLSAEEAASYLELPRAMGCTLLRSRVEGGCTVFAGNDDAGVEGSMANALRWQCHAHRVMLVGGRAAYEAAVAGLLGVASGRSAVVSPTPLALHCTSDHLARLPPPLAWRHLTARATCLPRDTASELGTFVLWTLSYDTLHTLAESSHRVSSQSRLPEAAKGAAGGVEGPPTFLPATLALLPRIAAHPALRRAHVGATSLPPKGGAFFPPCAVPLWRLSADQATWTEMEGVAE